MSSDTTDRPSLPQNRLTTRQVGALLACNEFSSPTITELKIDTEVIRSVALVVLSGIALGCALTFGLGARDIIRNVIAGFYPRKLVDEGESIEIDGIRGTLLAVTPIKTMIQREDDIVVVSNDAFLKGAVRV